MPAGAAEGTLARWQPSSVISRSCAQGRAGEGAACRRQPPFVRHSVRAHIRALLAEHWERGWGIPPGQFGTTAETPDTSPMPSGTRAGRGAWRAPNPNPNLIQKAEPSGLQPSARQAPLRFRALLRTVRESRGWGEVPPSLQASCERLRSKKSFDGLGFAQDEGRGGQRVEPSHPRAQLFLRSLS